MLIRLVSDVHLEHYVHATVPAGMSWDQLAVPPRDRDSESVLVIAGDFCEFQYIYFYANMWKELAKRFKDIVYVPGNHEYFGNSTPYGKNTFFHFKELLRKYGRIHLLDNTGVTIDGTRFFGTTLWTDYADDPISMLACMRFPEFRFALDDNNGAPRTPVPQDYVNRYRVAVEALNKELEKGEDVVVITHFGPTHGSIHERYRSHPTPEINNHFAVRLENTILDNPQIKLWLHGHTHTQFEYTCGETRVICNPTGYPGEDTCRFADLDYIEL